MPAKPRTLNNCQLQWLQKEGLIPGFQFDYAIWFNTYTLSRTDLPLCRVHRLWITAKQADCLLIHLPHRHWGPSHRDGASWKAVACQFDLHRHPPQWNPVAEQHVSSEDNLVKQILSLVLLQSWVPSDAWASWEFRTSGQQPCVISVSMWYKFTNA